MRVRHLAATQSRQEPAANDHQPIAIAGTDRRRTGSGLTKRLRRSRCLGNGTGRTSGLLAARARTLGIAPEPAAAAPYRKPSRLTMNQRPLTVPPTLVPLMMAERAAHQRRVDEERDAAFGLRAASLAAFDLEPPSI